MILNDKLITHIQGEVTSIWLCNANPRLETDMVRLMGIIVDADCQHVTVFVPVRQGRTVISNLNTTDKISFLTADVYLYESYQIKGKYISNRACTPEEVAYQIAYIDKFTDALVTQGFPKKPAYGVYLQQPCIAVGIQVEEVYEQTPRKGTGQKLVV